MSTTLNRYVGRVSIADIDRHSTAGAFSTHDPVDIRFLATINVKIPPIVLAENEGRPSWKHLSLSLK